MDDLPSFAAAAGRAATGPHEDEPLIGADRGAINDVLARFLRGYSTTLTALRQAREQHVHEQLLARSTDAGQRALADSGERITSFRCVGQGHLTAADALLAASAAARAREHRRLAREERAMAATDRQTARREA